MENTRTYTQIVLATVVVSMMMVSTAEAKLLHNPEKMEWGCKLSMTKVKQGIKMGLIGRQWVAINRGKGLIEGKINVRQKHKLVVNVKYTRTSFDIDYKSSENLKYKKRDGKEYLHKNANSWMMNINNDILSHLSTMCN